MSKLDSKKYNKELKNLQVELIKLQEWIKQDQLKVVVLFEGRDQWYFQRYAGKGGAIKRITESLNPRICKVVALGTPTEKEKLNGIFKAMIKKGKIKLYSRSSPSSGEIVLFDRSWYNRAGVERVMGFCTNLPKNITRDLFLSSRICFCHSCPMFEQMLKRPKVRSDIML